MEKVNRHRFGSEASLSGEIVRAVSAADFAQLRELLLAYEEDLDPELRHGEVPSTERLAATHRGSEAAFLARRATRASGCVAVRDLGGGSALVLRLFVLPAHRGVGAARALVARAIDFALDRGYARIFLDTDKERLEPAYRLYRSFGFEECPPYAPVGYANPTYMVLRFSPLDCARGDRA
ncbi:MAG TPA: GNAT family N-acetyltransferase [Candidatus Cybelea sp.]|nr:GNAT family N-acetyltransferase [Candidatus Cybelea sp.]